MKIVRTLAPSIRTLLAHRVRSALAATGVAIGIAAVFLTAAVGQGAEATVLSNVGAMGARLLVVRPAQVQKSSARKELRGSLSSLKLEDAQCIRELPQVEAVAPSVEGSVKVKTTDGLVATVVLGTTAAFFQARSFEVERGRLWGGVEDRDAARVVVLGGRAARALFSNADPVGQEARIGGVGFEVIGTLKTKGASADGSDADAQVFIPAQTALRRVFNARSLTRVFVSVRESKDLDATEHQIRALLRERHRLDARDKPDDFAIQNQLRFLSAQRATARSLQYFTLGLSGLSLLIGGTGILAVMLLSVRERTPEIGLRMAVGARPRDILCQFLLEAVVLSLVGGVVGSAVGAAGATVLARATGWPVQASAAAALGSTAFALLLGVLFGALPARKAATIPIVRALGLQ